MADSVSLNLDINNSLLKSFEETNKMADQTNDKIGEMEQNLSKGAGVLDKMKGSLSSITRTFTRVGTTMGSFFAVGGIFDAARGILEVDQNMRDLSFQMGHGATQVKNFRDGVYEVSSATGVANDEVSQMFTTFARSRIAADQIESLAESTGHFVKITGASADAASGLASNLSRVGRLGSEGVENVMKSVVSVQREFGLASNEVEQLTDGMTGVTRMLSQMGKDSGFIENFNKGLARMSGAFVEVGLEAQGALDIVNQLLDPSKIEDNALLYSKMGISIQDAISGNINPEQISAGLKDIGMQLQNMSGPQAAAMAEQLGMPLQELRAMAEMDLSSTGDGIENMADASEEQAGPLRQIKEFWNSIQNEIAGILSDVLPLLMDGINKLFSFFKNNNIGEFFGNLMNNLKAAGNFLKGGLIIAAVGGMIMLFRKLRRNLFSIANDTRESLVTGVSEGLEMGYKKGQSKISKLRQSRQNAQAQASTERIRMNLESDRGQRATGMADTAEAFMNLGDQPKRLEKMLGTISNINRAYAKTGGFYNEFNVHSRAILNNLRNTHRQRVDTYNAELQILEIAYQQTNSDKERARIGQQITQMQNKRTQAKEKELMFMTKDERNALIQNNNIRERNLENEQRANDYKLKTINQERDLNRQVIRQLKEQSQNADLSAKERQDAYFELKKHKQIHEELNNERDEAINKQKDLNEQLQNAQTERAQAQAAQDVTMGKRITEGIKTAITRPFDKLGNGFRRVRLAIDQNGGAMKLLGKQISVLGKKMGGKLLSGIGKMAKMALPLMIIAPLMQKLQPLFEVLIGVLDPLFDILKDVIGEILIALSPLFAMLVNKLLPPLLYVLGGALVVIGKLIEGIANLIDFMAVDLPMKIGRAVRPNKYAERMAERLGADYSKRDVKAMSDEELKAIMQEQGIGATSLVQGMRDMATSLQDTGAGMMAQGQYYMSNQLIDGQELQNSLRDAMNGVSNPGEGGAAAGGDSRTSVNATGSGFEMGTTAASERESVSDTLEENERSQAERDAERNEELAKIEQNIRELVGLTVDGAEQQSRREQARTEALMSQKVDRFMEQASEIDYIGAYNENSTPIQNIANRIREGEISVNQGIEFANSFSE